MNAWLRFPVLLLAAMLLVITGITVSAEDEFDPVPEYTSSQEIDPSPVNLPDMKRKQLGNGLTVYYVPHEELPVAGVRLLIPTGMLYNPMDNPGLVSFMAGMLDEGTENRSSTQIAEEIDFVGGSLRRGSGWNAIYIQSEVLTRDLELAIDLVADCAQNSIFPEEEIARIKQEVSGEIMRSKDNSRAIASREFDRVVYGDHPYSLPDAGTLESVQGFTREDIIAQYERLVVPDRAILTIAGDIDWKKTHKLVKKYFSGWEKRGEKLPDPGDPQELPGGKVLLIDKPDAVQSDIMMGYVLAPYNMGDDFHAFQVMNYIFGSGGFASRMMQRIRNELGLVYDTRSYLSSMQKKGAYTFSASTGNETTGKVIEEMISLMENTIEEGFTEEEMRDARSFLIGRYPARFETPEQIATQFQSAIMFDFPDPRDHIQNYRERIAEVTLEEINAMAKKYLRPEALRIVVVSKGDDVREQLAPLGELEEINVEELKI